MKRFSGRIDIILGPMFSGKTSHLIRLIKSYQSNNKSCLVLNHVFDSRYTPEPYLLSHNNEQIPAKKISLLEEIIQRKEYQQHDVIAIDEAQFFKDIVKGAEFLANEGKHVLVSGLDGTFLRKPFGDLINLIPLAESVTKLHAKCVKCQDMASFTMRINSEEKKDILVGDEQVYAPLCRKCYFMHEMRRKNI